MKTVFHTLFDTALGPCALAWSEDGIVAGQLPEADRAATLARLRKRFPETGEAEPPAAVRSAAEAIRALFAGAPADLSGVALDMDGIGEFDRSVYAIARELGCGETTSYGAIARRLGDVSLSREVGQALGRNPFAPIVPCHRVVAADGGSGGFSAAGGARTKMRMLAIEKARGVQQSLFDA